MPRAEGRACAVSGLWQAADMALIWKFSGIALVAASLLIVPSLGEAEKSLKSNESEVPVDVLIARLESESFQERSAARQSLVERLHDPSDPGLTELLAARYAKSPEVRDQANTALKEIFALQVLGTGRRDCGVEWIYWIDRKNGKTFAYPYIRALKPESFLAKAGLKVGDAIEACDGRIFNQRGSIAALAAVLEKAPTGKPLEITVIRPHPSKLTKDRVQTLSLKIIPADTGRTAGRDENPGEYDAWLKSLGKTGTVPKDPQQ